MWECGGPVAYLLGVDGWIVLRLRFLACGNVHSALFFLSLSTFGAGSKVVKETWDRGDTLLSFSAPSFPHVFAHHYQVLISEDALR